MHNSNLTLGKEVVPQSTLEAIQKLIHVGNSTEDICFVLGLKPEVVRQVIDNDPQKVTRLLQVIRNESRKFRCTQSDRLMISPVFASDGSNYDESSLAKHPSLASLRAMPNPKLKAEISEFSKRTLARLEVHLQNQSLPDDFFQLFAECLSVLDFKDEVIWSVLSAVQEQSIQKLALKLRNILPQKRLVSMIQHAAERQASLALYLIRLNLVKPIGEGVTQENIMCITEVLRKTALREKAFELVEEVYGNLSTNQLDYLIQALKAEPVEVRQRLELMKLKAVNRALTTRLAEAEHLLQVSELKFRRLHQSTAPIIDQLCPDFIYSFEIETDQLHRTNLVTGEKSSHSISQHQFKTGSCWSELPGGTLFITGGIVSLVPRRITTSEVVRIETLDEFAVSNQERMYFSRSHHAAVYYDQYVFALGGFSETTYTYESLYGKLQGFCERFICAENRWERLPEMPRPCESMSAIVAVGCLFSLGGHAMKRDIKAVQRLNLDTLTWKLLKLKLPRSGKNIPCFKKYDTKIYLVMNCSLYAFNTLKFKRLKVLGMAEGVVSYGPNLYSRGTLFCSNQHGPASRLEIGYVS
jgi:hypothetical protein